MKSSSSSKPSPATTLSSSQMPSLTNSPNVLASHSVPSDINSHQTIQTELSSVNPSLATMLAAAYTNGNGSNNFSMFHSSQGLPTLTPQQPIPTINNSTLAALLSQKENFTSGASSLPSMSQNPTVSFPQQPSLQVCLSSI